jgi:NADH:ubiquinone oxidoreductase subunit 3 (subunit A)
MRYDIDLFDQNEMCAQLQPVIFSTSNSYIITVFLFVVFSLKAIHVHSPLVKMVDYVKKIPQLLTAIFVYALAVSLEKGVKHPSLSYVCIIFV